MPRRPFHGSDIDLGPAEIALPLPPVAGQAVAALATRPCGQPPPGGLPELRELLAARLAESQRATGPDEVAVVAGACAAVSALVLCQSSPGDAVLLPDPGFPAYHQMTRVLDRVPVRYPVPVRPGDHRWLDVAPGDLRRAAVIVWNSPHNATGRVARASECELVAEFARRHRLFLVSDEVCHDLTWSVPHASPLDWADHGRAAGVWSASKALRMPGYRIGWLSASAAVVTAATEAAWSLTMSAPMPGQIGCAAVLADYPAVLAQSRAHVRRNIEAIRQALPGALPAGDPEGGLCVWLDVAGTPAAPASLAARLQEDHGIRVWPGERFGPRGRGFIRVNAGAAHADIDGALPALRALLGLPGATLEQGRRTRSPGTMGHQSPRRAGPAPPTGGRRMAEGR